MAGSQLVFVVVVAFMITHSLSVPMRPGAFKSKRSVYSSCTQAREKALQLIEEGAMDVEVPKCDGYGSYMAGPRCSWTGCYCQYSNGTREAMPSTIVFKDCLKGDCERREEEQRKLVEAGVMDGDHFVCDGNGFYKPGYYCSLFCYCIMDKYNNRSPAYYPGDCQKSTMAK